MASKLNIGLMPATLAVLCLLANVQQVQAHHSFAMFNKQAPVDLKGVVHRVEWKNPHVFLFVTVSDGKGGAMEYAVECASPSMLLRSGWKYNTLKEGDAVMVKMYPLLDGQPGGLLEAVTLPNGSVIKG